MGLIILMMFSAMFTVNYNAKLKIEEIKAQQKVELVECDGALCEKI